MIFSLLLYGIKSLRMGSTLTGKNLLLKVEMLLPLKVCPFVSPGPRSAVGRAPDS